jgi:hypothetical protein
MDGEDAAVMDLKLQLNLPGVPQGPGGGGAPQVPIPFVMLEDGSWRIELPYFPPTELLAQTRSNLDAQVPGISQQIDQVMHDIQSGSLTNPQAIQQRLMMSSFGLMGAFTPIIDHVRQAMAGEPAEPHADPGQPPDTEDAEPPAPEDGGQE